MALQFLNDGYFAGNVGIGTESPSGKLEITSNSSLSSYITQYTNDADGAELVIRTARGTQAVPVQYNTGDSAGRLLFQAYTSAGEFEDAASIESVMESGSANAYGGLRFNFMPNYSPYVLTEGMRLNMSGNVGIGEANIDARLHISAKASNGISNVKLESPGASKWVFGIPASETYFALDDVNDNLTTPRLVVLKTSGNVGIGTVSPTSPLTIKSNSTSSSSSGLTIQSNGNTNNIFELAEKSTDGARLQMYDAGVAKIALYTDGTDNYINAGNVGIGTTSPTTKLNVSGNIAVSSGSYLSFIDSNLNYNKIGRNTSVGGIQITTGASATMNLLDNGNVGIGTTSPLGKLQVNEYTVASQGNQGVHGEVSVFANDGDESLFLGLRDSAYPNRGWAINPVAFGVNSSLQFKEHGSTGVRMVIESGGFVGLGVTDPQQKLHIVDTDGANIILNSNTGAENNGIWMTEGGTSTPYVNGAYVHYDSTNNVFKINTGTSTLSTRFEIARDTGAIKFNNYNSTNQTGTPTYLLGTDASGNVVKTLTTPSPVTSQAASLYDLIPNGAFTTTYAFTSTAGTYAEVMKGDDVITANGTYTVQMFVDDYAVGGTQYSETYSGIMSWGSSTNTNDTGGGTISEIVLHRSGHAANQGMTYLRTRETTSSEGNELRLEIMCNRTYTGASNVVFKFVRLI